MNHTKTERHFSRNVKAFYKFLKASERLYKEEILNCKNISPKENHKVKKEPFHKDSFFVFNRY